MRSINQELFLFTNDPCWKCEVDTDGRENLVRVRDYYLPIAPLQDRVRQLQECLWITSPRTEYPGKDTIRDLLEEVLENAVKLGR